MCMHHSVCTTVNIHSSHILGVIIGHGESGKLYFTKVRDTYDCSYKVSIVLKNIAM